MKLFDWMLSGFLFVVLLVLVIGGNKAPAKIATVQEKEIRDVPQDSQDFTLSRSPTILENPRTVATTSEARPVSTPASSLKDQISLAVSRSANMEQTLLAMLEVIATPIDGRPNMNFWDKDVVAFPFEASAVKAHFFLSGREETLAYGAQIEVPISEPFFHDGAYRRAQNLKASYSPFHQQLIVILEEPIDFYASEGLGLSVDSTIPLGMSWGRDEKGERCFLSYWKERSIHADMDSPCYAGAVSAQTVNQVISRLSQLERQVRSD